MGTVGEKKGDRKREERQKGDRKRSKAGGNMDPLLAFSGLNDKAGGNTAHS